MKKEKETQKGKGEYMKAFLILEDGTVFTGTSIGSTKDMISEIVFNTSMTGYLEVLTDPSYAGQAVVMTYPLIGNYGITPDMESRKAWPDGYIVRELSRMPSNFRCEGTIQDFLKEQDIPGIAGIDTRALTKILREKGTMNGMITTNENYNLDEILPKLKAYTVGDVVSKVTCDEKYVLEGNGPKVALMDFGAKKNIAKSLNERGCEVTVYPAGTKAEEIIAANPDGCNQFCSYCIIPFARGRVRSRSRDSVLDEVKTLSANGYKEVVLTGIHLSSYGIDCDDNLLSLILAIHEVEGIERIRLGSLEPRIITEEFAQTIAKLPKMCPHFHLSLQSGCNATLKRMNRRYTAEEYYEKCQLLRKYFDNPALTTDVIVGFPGETEEEFAESKAFVDKVDFYETHIFKYSRREGTKAAAMKDQVPDQIKAARSAELLELNRKKQAVYEERLLGTTQEVLIEEKIVRDGEELQIGHTKEYVKIGVKNPNNLINQLVNVEIENQLQILH